MKKNLKYFAMVAVVLLTISSCSKEGDEQPPKKGKQPVEFQMGLSGANTRTITGAADRTTVWSEGDAVGIFVYKAGTTTEPVMVNAQYVLTGNKWVAAEGSEIYPEAAYDYYAYYPYQKDVTDPLSISVASLADQSKTDGTDYGLSDILAAPKTAVSADATTVALTFNHLFAMVEVQVKGDLVTKKPTKVMLKSVKLGATLDLLAATPAAAVKADGVGDVNMYYLTKIADDDKAPFSYRAVVPAQSIVAGTTLVSIEAPDAAGKTYVMQHSSEVTYLAGKFRQLVVTIGSAKVSLEIPKGDMTINPWEDTPAIPGTGGEPPFIIPLVGNISVVDLGNMDPHANISPIKDIDSWYIRRASTTDGSDFELQDGTYNGKAVKMIKLISKTANFGWYKMVAGFYKKNANCDITKKYRLSFAVKGAEGTTLQYIIRTSGNAGSFAPLKDGAPLSGVTSSRKIGSSEADSWVTVTTDYTLGKKQIGNPASINLVDATADDASSLDFRFYSSAASTTFYITDVKFEEVVETTP